jgi:hypothetical protein
MKTLILTTRKAQRSFVPITAFQFERFEVRVRRAKRRRPLPTEVSFKKVLSKAFPGNSTPYHDRSGFFMHTTIFLPSPSLQGRGPMCLPLGARSVHRNPAALSPPEFQQRNIRAQHALALDHLCSTPSPGSGLADLTKIDEPIRRRPKC